MKAWDTSLNLCHACKKSGMVGYLLTMPVLRVTMGGRQGDLWNFWASSPASVSVRDCFKMESDRNPTYTHITLVTHTNK